MSKENNMCSYIHFFGSQEEAAQWLAEKGVEGTTLSIEEGYELGRRAFADLLNYVSGDVYTQASELSP